MKQAFTSMLALFFWAVVSATVSADTAIVGATVIDGNGGPPLANATVVIIDKRIVDVGPRAAIKIPAGARIIDGTGKFITPGFIDTNVHVSLYGGGEGHSKETAVAYWQRNEDLTLEMAQMHLKYGVTTIRDSYGTFPALKGIRERIARGEAIGPRLLFAGNIVGWGGPYSATFSLVREEGLSLWEEQYNDAITQGSGEELMDMYPEELRVAINKYLDKGVDFIKYGGTSHWFFPTMIGFSPEAQRVIVEETHKRGLVAETHATNPEGLRLSVEAGIDLIQHPEVLWDKEMSDELVREIRERNIICSMLINTITGEAWEKHLKDKEEAQKKLAEKDKEAAKPGLRREVKREKTSAERRKELRDLGHSNEMRRLNAKKLIDGGCTVTLGTDNWLGEGPEYSREPKSRWQEPGHGTIAAIEGLVELGMSPAQAIVAATKNGAMACKALDEYGTIEAGKLADLLVLDADPLAEISNIRKLGVVMKEGQIIDHRQLPTKRIFYER
jgi:imidazolonepropionase-like amidohydrolase